MAKTGSGSAEIGSGGATLDDLNAKLGSGVIIDPADFERGTDSGSISGGNGSGTGNAGNDGARLNRDGSVPKKRGRKPGSKNAKTSASARVDISGLEKILTSLHFMAASALSIPELQLDKDESQALASAMADVSSHYDTAISAEMMAWINLAAVGASIYGPRAFVIINRRREEKKPKVAKTAEDVAVSAPTNIGVEMIRHASSAG